MIPGDRCTPKEDQCACWMSKGKKEKKKLDDSDSEKEEKPKKLDDDSDYSSENAERNPQSEEKVEQP